MRHLVVAAVAAAVVALVAPGAGACRPAVPAAAAAETPAVRAESFYRWYVKQFADANTPTHDMKMLNSYVSPALQKQLKRQAASPDGVDSDYFLRAQDNYDDWLTAVKATPISQTASAAKVRLTVGDKHPHSVSVSMVKDGAGWKISRVDR